MYNHILSKEQEEILPLIKFFSKDYYLVGGTAVALHLGHRRSIDFDLFTDQRIKRISIKNNVKKLGYKIEKVYYEDIDQLHIAVNSVKVTFFNYPYKIPEFVRFNDIIKIPVLLDLAAMKAYALGGRAKWKDYVDLYFILKNHYSFDDISKRAEQIFESSFNRKLFREQLSYYNDVDYSEDVVYLGEKINNGEIESYLTEISLTPF
jgi:hypothetical protein